MLDGFLHVVLEPGGNTQHRHLTAVAEADGGSAGELVHGVDEALAALVCLLLVPQIFHCPAQSQ